MTQKKKNQYYLNIQAEFKIIRRFHPLGLQNAQVVQRLVPSKQFLLYLPLTVKPPQDFIGKMKLP